MGCFSGGKKMSERSELFFPEEKYPHGALLKTPNLQATQTQSPKQADAALAQQSTPAPDRSAKAH
ncbi:hypothetical protein MSSD14B_02990 [Marinobacter salsuginis]|uniref:Uncharacterized protein n=1 Tax=Marinobacter salsuginis TaxID=418719 RepID=A0A5M3PUZ4_9GAMM|nr:hypothetical protein MSSD14B_02990 [Marinobacter salsuginis]